MKTELLNQRVAVVEGNFDPLTFPKPQPVDSTVMQAFDAKKTFWNFASHRLSKSFTTVGTDVGKGDALQTLLS